MRTDICRMACALAAAAAAVFSIGRSPAWAAERLHADIGRSGRIALMKGQAHLATIESGLFEAQWRGAGLGGAAQGETTKEMRRGKITSPGGKVVECELKSGAAEGGLALAYKLVPRAEMNLNSLHVSLAFPARVLAGGKYVADGDEGEFPAEFKDVHLRSKPTRSLAITAADGTAILLKFAEDTPVLLQDDRKWGPSFTVRIGPQMDGKAPWPKDKALDISFELTAKEGIEVEYDEPVTIQAGPDWIPLKLELDVEPGSALDFSKMGWIDAPAGKQGRVIARDDGQFAFEKAPDKPARFYGVNFCFSAHYISHEESDRLAERLMRLGYNTIRIHHYEGELTDKAKGSSRTFKEDKLDQLDYFFAAFKKRGIYVTTDLFVSRPVLAREVWDDAQGDGGMDNFKMAVPVNENAFENWKEFAKNLLTHVNPHSGLRYADDPALAWLSMINEGNFGNYIGRLPDRLKADWQKAWNRWLVRKYGDRAGLEKAWGGELGKDEDPAAGSVPLYTNLDGSTRGLRLAVFLAETEADMFARMRKFLREEIGTKALLTNMNGWTNRIQDQAARADYDYVDDHFYVDHPQFLEQSWRLPSRCDNRSPVAAGAPGGRHCAFVRAYGKPFTISEYNYSGPGQYRGVGGIVTGCMGALQGWGVIWRFAYSHNRANLFAPGTAGYFDVASDPLNQAAERASVCLFLRGDMKPAPHSVTIGLMRKDLITEPRATPGVAPPWHALALVTRVGTFLNDGTKTDPGDIVMGLGWGPPNVEPPGLSPYSGETGAKILDAMRAKGWLKDNATDLVKNVIQSETGELLVDAPRDVLTINTPMTAGGYAPAGGSVSAGPVTVRMDKVNATVWASSLDGKPIAESRRLILTHLTDLQNTEAKFGEKARQTLLAWGKLPHLVRAGKATAALKIKDADKAKVYSLATSGKRGAPVEAKVVDGALVVPLDVSGPDGARMLYEIEVP